MAIGSTLYPPSAEAMGVLPSPAVTCLDANSTLNNNSTVDVHTRLGVHIEQHDIADDG